MQVENQSQTEDELLVSTGDIFHFHDGPNNENETAGSWVATEKMNEKSRRSLATGTYLLGSRSVTTIHIIVQQPESYQIAFNGWH